MRALPPVNTTMPSACAVPGARAAEISATNVTNPAATPPYRVFEMIGLLAAARGIETSGGELIGCIPRAAVEETAAYSLGVTAL